MSCGCLKIRSHDICNSANLDKVPQIIRLKRFKRYVQADLVAVLEAVGDRLRRAVRLDAHTFNKPFLDALGESGTRRTDETDRESTVLGSRALRSIASQTCRGLWVPS